MFLIVGVRAVCVISFLELIFFILRCSNYLRMLPWGRLIPQPFVQSIVCGPMLTSLPPLSLG